MLHVNETISWLGYLFPDVYNAISVSDFLLSKNNIPIRSRWRFLNPLSYATAYIHVKPKKLEMLAIINFHNINLAFGERRYTLFDMTGKFTVYPPISGERIALGTCVNPNELIEGRYFEVTVLYSQKEK